MTAVATRQALGRLSRPLRGRAIAGWCALGLGAVASLLGLAAWTVRLEWVVAPSWVLVAWAIALLLLLAAAWLGWRSHRGLSPSGVADRLERAGAWRRGTLTALLDSSATGTSETLFGAADRAQAADLERRGSDATASIAASLRRVLLAGGAVLLLGAMAFGSAGPVRGTAAALWHPLRAWKATVAPVSIAVDEAQVDRGDSVAFRVEAFGRKVATLWTRAPGESWRPRGVRLDSLGRAVVVAGPLESDLYARVTSGSRGSDTVFIQVRLPVFLGSLTVTAHYPRYLRLESEPVPTTGDTLLLPAGTTLETKGEATAPLARALWKSAAREEALDVRRAGFSGSFVPMTSGGYELLMETVSGAPLAGDTVRLPIRIVRDSAPHVEVPLPGADTVAPLSLQVPLVVDVRDDYGITGVAVESRRISRLGAVDSAQRESLPLPDAQQDRAILTYTLDLNRRGLLPGDTLRYFAVATDNTPGRQAGRSREYVIRLPTMSEVRAAQRSASDDIGGRLDSAAAESRRLERQTEDLARERPRSEGTSRENGEALSYEQAKRAEGVAKAQDQLLRQAEELKQSIDELRRSAEAAGMADSAWQRQLQEIREQIDRALSPELRERLADLQRALKDLDAEAAKDALERLAQAQQELREALERSRDLFERAALEGDLANLTQETRDLAREQQQWNQQVAKADSANAAMAERQLAARADSLAAALKKVSKEMEAQSAEQRLGQAAQQAGNAAQQMKQAAGAVQEGARQEARRRGQRAAESLEPLGDQLAEERRRMQQEWREEVVRAIDNALAETGRLAERQLGIEEALQNGSQSNSAVRSEQAAVEEGVQRLLEQVRKTAGKNALVPPGIGAALGGAQEQMQRTREAIGSAAPNLREAAEQAGEAVDGLNAAAHQLLRARGEVSGAESGTGLAEAMERMAQLAQQQGGLGQQGAGLLPMAGSSAIQEQLRQLGMRQRALAQELERMRGEGNMPGAGELAEEAKELARRLESGRFDRQVVERQERLFRRMLDAGRTLQGREEDEQKERQSTTASEDSVRLPPALRARLGTDGDRLRVPTWEELQEFSPEERRLVVDYFRRLSEQRP